MKNKPKTLINNNLYRNIKLWISTFFIHIQAKNAVKNGENCLFKIGRKHISEKVVNLKINLTKLLDP